MGAKYGCGKGQRLRVIGETCTLLQFDGGKTAPKNQEDKGWKWVTREEEQAKEMMQREKELEERRKQVEREKEDEANKWAELAREAEGCIAPVKDSKNDARRASKERSRSRSRR